MPLLPKIEKCLSMGVLVSALLVGVGPGAAHAAAGEHVQLGQGELIPSVSASTRWASNVYQKEAGEIAALSVLVRPAIQLNVDGYNVRLDLEGAYGVEQFLNSTQQRLSSYGQTALYAKLELLPKSKISVKSSIAHSRKTDAVEKTGGDDSLITFISNRGSGALSINPGSALSLDAGGFASYDDYRVPVGASATGDSRLNNRLGYGPEASLKWTFFPRTAVLANYSYYWYDWATNDVNARGGSGTAKDTLGEWLAMPNSKGWRALLGLHGRFTERLVLSLSGGYGRAIYDESSVTGLAASDSSAGDFSADLNQFPDALIVRTALQWSPRRGHTLDIGYWKDHQDSWFTNFVQYHYGYLRYDGMLTSRALFGLEGGYRLETYKGEVTRGDHVVRADAYLTYRTNGWADVSLRGFWSQRSSANSDLGIGADEFWIEYDNYGGVLDLTLRY